MATYATLITDDGCPMEAASDAARYHADAVGGKDKMDEGRRLSRTVRSDLAPYCGPRGGIGRVVNLGGNVLEDTCPDGDAEDRLIAGLDARRTAEWLGLEFVGCPSDEQIDLVARAIELRVREDEEAEIERESVAPPATMKRRRIVRSDIAPRRQGVIEAGFDLDTPAPASEPVLAAAPRPTEDEEMDRLRREYRLWRKKPTWLPPDRRTLLAFDRTMAQRHRLQPKPRIARQLRFN